VAVWYSRTRHRRQQGACALHDGRIRLQTHTQICTTYCFLRQQLLHERAFMLCYTCSAYWLKDSTVYSGSMNPKQSSGGHFIVRPIIIHLSTYVIPDQVRLFKQITPGLNVPRLAVLMCCPFPSDKMSQSTNCYMLQEHFHCQREASTYIISLPLSGI
jgi:hypothetical protein